MKIIKWYALIIMSIFGYSNAMALLDSKTQDPDEFYSYTPGQADSYHIYYPGDVVIFEGVVYENIKLMNNSHLPSDSNMLGSYWQEIKLASERAI